MSRINDNPNTFIFLRLFEQYLNREFLGPRLLGENIF